MKNQVSFKIRGHRADVGGFMVHRLLPNQHVFHVGHFVFLDYIGPFPIKDGKHLNPDFAHPHRGIATLTYVLSGEVEHFDSRGHNGVVHAGGAQWMKAGNGIIHNESYRPDSTTPGRLAHGFQFWVNLPGAIKRQDPEYMAVQAAEMPLLTLPDGAGTLKVVIGAYEGQASRIPTYARQYLYHVRLAAGQRFVLPTEAGLEYAAFLPQHDLTINGEGFHAGELVGFAVEAGELEFVNGQASEAEFLVFGGAPYTEPFVAHGPFVMNTEAEIQAAFADFRHGKYGTIDYGAALS